MSSVSTSASGLSKSAMRWTLAGTRGTSRRRTEPFRLAWESGVLEGPQRFVDEWQRVCRHYAGQTFFITTGVPLRTCTDPANDPVVSFVIAVNWLPVWSAEAEWEPEIPTELLAWEPQVPNVIPFVTARDRR